MILHAAEVWGMLAVGFVVGTVLGAMIMRSILALLRRMRRRIEQSRARRRPPPKTPIPLPEPVAMTAPPIRRTEETSPAVAPSDASTHAPEPSGPIRPLALAAPRHGVADDLTLIRGLGKRHAGKLASIGVFHFSQIAAWTPQEIAFVAEFLEFGDVVTERDWVGQATALASLDTPPRSGGLFRRSPKPRSRRGKARRSIAERAAPPDSADRVDEIGDP